MFEKNMGMVDRAVRAVIGVLLLILAFTTFGGVWAWIAGLIGIVLLATAAMGTCPPYSLLGIDTRKTKA